jgi:Ca2+/H+ antiporter, TMEM165/GDT1 family
MKFRRRPSPLLLLLIPSISSILVSATPGGDSSDLSNNREARNAKVLSPTATIPLGQLSLKPTSKVDVGTKDAPVDGKDGKPHAGPFVDYEKDRKQTPATEDGEPVTKKPTTLKDAGDEKFPDGMPIPEVNDGVMNDPSRELPRQGTTGTQGGVSEKDKVRKAQEGQTSEKLEKKPDSPKEAPPLPHSEQEKIDKKEKDTAKQAEKDASKKNKGKDSDVDDASELLGLEVC